jgi:hypothetical protein
MNVMLLMIPALLLAMEVAPMSAIFVSPPRFDALPGTSPPTREPLLLRVGILEDGFRVETHGSKVGEGDGPSIPLADPAREGAERYDYAALQGLAQQLKAMYPEESTVTLAAEGSIPLQTVVATLDALRGPACAVREPRACLFWQPVIDASI